MFLCSSEQCLKYSTVLLYTGSFPLTSAALSISDTAYLLYQLRLHHYSNFPNRGLLGHVANVHGSTPYREGSKVTSGPT